MDFLEEDPNVWWEYKDIVNSKISIVELMRKYNLQLEESSERKYRTYCPFHKGKNGGIERTPSLYAYEDTNSFFCFGCGSSGRPIDFVSFIDGTPVIIVIQKLAKEIGLIENGKFNLEINTKNLYEFDQSKTIEPYILETSTIVRSHIEKFINTKTFEKELRWVEKICKKLDEHLNKIGNEDWEYAIKLRDILKKKIESRRPK